MSNPTPIPGLNPKGTVPPPPASIKHPNTFMKFFSTVGHAIEDVFKFAPKFGEKVIRVIEEAEELTPEFLSELQTLMTAVASLVASSASAVGEKGLNPLQDTQALAALETVVKDFDAFYPTVIKFINSIEGVSVAPVLSGTPPTPSVPPTEPAPEGPLASSGQASEVAPAQSSGAVPLKTPKPAAEPPAPLTNEANSEVQ